MRTAVDVADDFQNQANALSKHDEILRQAIERYQQTNDWISFFREVLGVDGLVRRYFSSNSDLEEFERSSEYAEIQSMLARLRTRKDEQETEPTRVITVRLPKCLHDSLKAEANAIGTSMNKLCISKLLLVIDEEMVPKD